MSIEEIKSIKKLKEMLRIEIMDNKYLKECCEKAGFELAKNSFEWDGKPKNLVVYAFKLNTIIDQLKAENEELKKDNSTLKDILSYPKYTNENAYNELLKLSKAELIKNLIESHQHGESTTQVVYRSISEENEKYKQTLTEIKEIAEKLTDDYGHKVSNAKIILQKISEVEDEQRTISTSN